MAKRLKNLVIRQVALVDRGANPEARIALRKAATEDPCDNCGASVAIDGTDPTNDEILFSHCAGDCGTYYTTSGDGIRKQIDGTAYGQLDDDLALAKSRRALEEVKKMRTDRHDSETESADPLAAFAKAFGGTDVAAGGAAVPIPADQLDEGIRARALQRYRDRGSPAPASRWLPRIYNEILAEAVDPFLPVHSRNNPTWGMARNTAVPTSKHLEESRDLIEKRDGADHQIETLVADVQRKHADWSALKCRDAAMRSEAYQKLYDTRRRAEQRLRQMEENKQ